MEIEKIETTTQLLFILFMFIKFSSMLFIKFSSCTLLLDELDVLIFYGKLVGGFNPSEKY